MVFISNNITESVDSKKIIQAELILILAGLSFGMVPILSALLRNNGVSSVEQVFIRHLTAMIFALCFIISFYLKKNPLFFFSLGKKVQLSYAIQGIIMNLMIIVYVVAISLNTPAGEAALFVQIHPISTFLISYLWLKETINRQKIYSLCLAMIGIVILLRPWELENFGKYFIGDLLSMSNGFFYSFYIITGRKAKNARGNIPSALSTFWVMIWAFIVGLFFLSFLKIIPMQEIINRFDIIIYSDPMVLFLGICLGLSGSILPYGLLMIGGRYVESSKSAILLLGEPFGAVLFGFLILSEAITINYIIGGFFLFLAVVLIAKMDNGKQKIEKTNEISSNVNRIDL